MATTAVFHMGPLAVAVKKVGSYLNDVHRPPKPLMVVAPTEARTDPYPYPVVVFLHGCDLATDKYEQLLSYVASHGFIVVAPQLYASTFLADDSRDVDATKNVTNWLAGQYGLQFLLENKLNLQNVKADLSKLALAGHSRGGHTAFALALGLGLDPKIELALKFSALIGVDPVAGPATGNQMEPKILTFKPRSLDVGMPALVLGTGLGPAKNLLGSCAPAGVNHAAFYDECKPPRYHFVAEEYGHNDMLDDDVHFDMGKKNKEGTKQIARSSMGGLMVAFLRATLEHKDGDLKAILDNLGLSPAKLNPVEHDLE